jgi:hypothetical protein
VKDEGGDVPAGRRNMSAVKSGVVVLARRAERYGDDSRVGSSMLDRV